MFTYGTYVGIQDNTGHNNGLWKIFQDYRLEKFSEPVAPILTGVVHTSQVWHGIKYQKLKIC